MLAYIVVLVVACAIYYYTGLKKSIPVGTRPLPGPTGLPYFGNIFQVSPTLYITLTNWAAKYGSIFLVKLGVKRWVVISDAKVAYELLVKRGPNYSNRDTTVVLSEIVHPGNIGIIASSGEYWRKTRRIAHAAMAQKAVDSYTPFIETETVELVRELYGKSFDPAVSLRRCTLNVMYTVLYGKRFASSEDPVFEELMKDALDLTEVVATDGVLNFLPILKYLPTGNDKKAMLIMKSFFGLMKTFWDEFKEEKSRGEDKPCIAGYILEHMEEQGFNDFDVYNIFVDLFAGGVDTTSTTMSWITELLVTHPEVQSRAHAELDAVIGRSRLPTRTDEPHLPYIRAIIREAMRFRPVSGWVAFPHQSVEEDTFDGHHIPADVSIIVNNWAIHMNPETYPNPEKFNPERFLDHDESSARSANGPIEKRDHVAFGWGRRMCPGINLAEAETFTATALLLWSYRLEIEDGGVVPDINAWEVGIVMAPKPFKVKFVPRHEAVKKLIFT